MIHVECVHFKSSKVKHESCDQNYQAGKSERGHPPPRFKYEIWMFREKALFYHTLKDCILFALPVGIKWGIYNIWQQLLSSWHIQMHKSLHFLVMAPQRCLIVAAQSALLQLMSRQFYRVSSQMPLHVWIVSSCTRACHLHSDSLPKVDGDDVDRPLGEKTFYVLGCVCWMGFLFQGPGLSLWLLLVFSNVFL